MVCHQSGKDSHASLKFGARDRLGSRIYPPPEAPTVYNPGELGGGTGESRAKPKPQAKTSRATKRQAALDRLWLALVRDKGWIAEDVAQNVGLSVELVAAGLDRAVKSERGIGE